MIARPAVADGKPHAGPLAGTGIIVSMTRPTLLIVLSLSAIAVCLVSAVLFLNGGSDGTEPVTVDLPAPGAAPERAMVQVDGVDEKLPIYVVHGESGEVFALVGRDPHSGCSVDWLPDYDAAQLGETEPGAFKARCSGWVFSRDGRVLFGAAARGLDRVAVTLKDDGARAEVDPSRFILGACRQPGQSACSPDGSPQYVSTLPLPMVRPRP